MPIDPEDRIAAVKNVSNLRAIGLSNEEIVEALRRRYRPESTGLPDSPEAQSLRSSHYRRIGKFGFDPFEAPLDEQQRGSIPEPILSFLDSALSPVGILALAAGGPLGRGLAGAGAGVGRALMSGKAGAVAVNAFTDSFFFRGVMSSVGFSAPFTAGEIAERVEAGEPFMAEAARVMLWSGAIDAAFGALRLPRLLRERAARVAGEIANDSLMAGLSMERPAVTAAASAAGKKEIAEGLGEAAAEGEAVRRASIEFAAAVDEASFLRKLERLGIPEQRIREHMLAVQEGASPDEIILKAGEATAAGIRRIRERLRASGMVLPTRLERRLFKTEAVNIAAPEGLIHVEDRVAAQFLGSVHTEAVIAGAEKAMTEGGLSLGQQRAVLAGATQQMLKTAGVESLDELATRFPTQARSIQLLFGRLDLADEAAAGGLHLTTKFDPRTLTRASDDFVRAGQLSPGDVVIPRNSPTPVTIRSIHAASRMAEAADPLGNRMMLYADDVVRRIEAAEQPGSLPPFVRKELAESVDELNAVRAARGAGPQARAAAALHRSPLAADPPPSTVVVGYKVSFNPVGAIAKAAQRFEHLPGHAGVGNAPLRSRIPISPTAGSLTREQRVATRLLERPEKEAAVKAARAAAREEALNLARTELKVSTVRREAIRILEPVAATQRRLAGGATRELREVLRVGARELADRGVEGRIRGFEAPKLPVVPDRLPVPQSERLLITLHNRVRELGGTGIEQVQLSGGLTPTRAGTEAVKRLKGGGAGSFAYRASLPDGVLTADTLPSLKAALDQYQPMLPRTPGQRLRQTLDAIEGKIPGCKPRRG